MFHRETFTPIFSRQILNGFAFDVEIIFIAKLLGFKMIEIPVRWEGKTGSTVNFVKDSFRLINDIIRIRLIYW